MTCTDVMAVVEGRAREVDAPDGVRLVRAPASGDDVLVECATDLAREGTPALVVTADRGLRARLPSATQVAGPRWLLDQLDRMDPPPPA
jgi:hypothetical protein